jgi:outer membrane protein assembly factor BamB
VITRQFLQLLTILLATDVLGGNWPGFRGPTGQGTSEEKELPLNWSATQNIAWKTELPGEGWSSPIIWNDHVFITSATEGGASCHVVALERTSGKILWDKEVFRQVPGHKQQRNSYATPTPCTDGERVYAVFGDGSFVALDFKGMVVWVNRSFPFYSEHGLGTSAILWQDLLIMARDGSGEPPDTGAGWHTAWDRARILALDKGTGMIRWEGKRGLSRLAHVVPNVWTAPDGHQELVSGAGDTVQGFDPKTGESLWSSRNIGEGVVPSIVLGNGLVFTASGWGGRESIKAFRPGDRGDLGEKNLVWEQRKGASKVPSYLFLKDRLYTINDAGLAMCLKSETGEIIWQERIGGNFSASPVSSENHIYFLSDEGETSVVETGPEFKVIARNKLNEKCQASIAMSQSALFIRTTKSLYCIKKQLAARAPP